MKLAPALEATHSINHRSQLMRQRARSAWLLLIPMLLVLAGVAGWPLSRTIWLLLSGVTSRYGLSLEFIDAGSFA